ncbi:MAG: SGNH/GDSL hydrolase family protein [Chryseosolibacter sp.]
MEGQSLAKTTTVKFLALGDSYTIGESVAEVQRWPVQLAGSLSHRGFTCLKPEIIAVTGWRTDDLMNALKAKQPGSDYNLVSLLIGVNNQYQGKNIDAYALDFEALLKSAIAYAGGSASQVFVLSIPDYGYTPFGKDKRREITQQIDAFNAVNKAITERNGIRYIDVTDISRDGLTDPELIAEDGLHPSGKMYALWVERIVEKMGW